MAREYSYSGGSFSPQQLENLRSSVYEESFARLVQAQFAVAFSHARTGLCSILSSLGIGPGDEVLLSPLTCKVVPLSLLSLGVIPKYVDITERTLNLNPVFLKKYVTPQTKAILFQYTYGNPGGIDDTVAFVKGTDIFLIEDCAQCTPVPFKGVLPGSRGIAAIYSHNLLKPIPAGSGGMATTNDADLGMKIQSQRDAMGRPGVLGNMALRMQVFLHNYVLRPEWYWWLFRMNQRVSSGYRDAPVSQEISCQVTKVGRGISSYQSQLGLNWLSQLPSLTAHRLSCCQEYFDGLKNGGHVVLPIQATNIPLYYFPVLVKDKEAVLEKAKEQHIEIIPWPVKMPIYPVTELHVLPSYRYEWGTCPVAEDVATRLVGLPTHQKVLPKHRQQILELIGSA